MVELDGKRLDSSAPGVLEDRRTGSAVLKNDSFLPRMKSVIKRWDDLSRWVPGQRGAMAGTKMGTKSADLIPIC